MRRNVIDKALLLKRFRKSAPFYDQSAVVQHEMARRLVELIAQTGRTEFPNILEIGSGTGLLTREIQGRLTFRKFYANDLVPESCAFVQAIIPGAVCLPGDAELLGTFPSDLDLVASNAVFQWFDDPAASLHRISSMLRPGGFLAFTTFGKSNFAEIQELVGNPLSYLSFEEIQGLAKSCLSVRHASTDKRTMHFPSPDEVLRHVHKTGVNANSHQIWGRKQLQAFTDGYQKFYQPGKGYPLTYEPFYFVLER